MLCYGLDHDLNPTKFSACFYACFTLEFNPEDDMEKMKKFQEDLTTLKRKSKTANPLKKKKLQKIREEMLHFLLSGRGGSYVLSNVEHNH
jgi:hypothetical protein